MTNLVTLNNTNLLVLRSAGSSFQHLTRLKPSVSQICNFMGGSVLSIKLTDYWQKWVLCKYRTEALSCLSSLAVPCYMAPSKLWQFISLRTTNESCAISSVSDICLLNIQMMWSGSHKMTSLWWTESQLFANLAYICKVPSPLPHNVIISC